jgi:hypothetical protein
MVKLNQNISAGASARPILPCDWGVVITIGKDAGGEFRIIIIDFIFIAMVQSQN